MWSRKGKVFDVPKELIKELEEILGEDEVLDGEIYRHDWRSSSGASDFQRVASATKKWNKDTPLLQYHVYDVPDSNLPYEDRFVKSDLIMRIKDSNSQRIKVVETILCKSEEEAMEIYQAWISGSTPYEGAMVRNVKGLYLFDHRSDDLQKIKPLDDAEFKIVGAKEGTGSDTGTAIFKCLAENGKIFEAKPTGSRESRQEYWSNLDHYIGQWLTVQFNGRTNDNLPRFPRGVKLRPEWDLDLREKEIEPQIKELKTQTFNPFQK